MNAKVVSLLPTWASEQKKLYKTTKSFDKKKFKNALPLSYNIKEFILIKILKVNQRIHEFLTVLIFVEKKSISAFLFMCSRLSKGIRIFVARNPWVCM